MKYLLVADLHYALKQYDWLLEVAEDFDVVVVAGDLLEAFSSVDRRTQIVVVKKYLERLCRVGRLIVCSGNHDLDSTDAAGEQTARWIQDLSDLDIATDSDTLFVGDTLISVCPWWDGPKGRRAIDAQLTRDARQRRGEWIWVYHAPPADSPVSWDGTRHFGDIELSQWIERFQPDMVLSGHVHQAPFEPSGSWVDRIGSTWVFNAGHQIGPSPAHIMFDRREATALWFSLAGNQIVELDRPLEHAPSPLVEVPAWIRA